MKPIISSLLLLACLVQAEDIALSDGRVFVDAAVGAVDNHGYVIISGKEHVARVHVSMLPSNVQNRIYPGREKDGAEAEPAGATSASREAVELSNIRVEQLDSSGGIVSYSWAVTVVNNTGMPMVRRSRIKLLRKDGIELAQAVGGPEAVGPHSRAVLTGTSEVREGVWKQRDQVEVVVVP